MNYKDVITIEPDKRSGKPTIRETRMTVQDVTVGTSAKSVLSKRPTRKSGILPKRLISQSFSKTRTFKSWLLGHPPKIVWPRVGNCPVKTVED